MKTKLLLAILLCLALGLGAQITVPAPSQNFISVSVTGFVANPGSYQLTPLNRISDALTLARSLPREPVAAEFLTPQLAQEAAQDSLFANFQGLRSIKLIRGRETTICDLLKYQRTGDLAQNPLLRDGDVIVVPAVHNSVTLSGEVYLPGEYEFVEGDDLGDLLALAQGFTLGADRANVQIYRYKENLVDFDILRHDLHSVDPDAIPLRAHDRVSVVRDAEFRRAWKITVEGSVKAPGEYLLGAGTTLYDVLLLCGGPTERGNLSSAIFANQIGTLEPDPEFERLKTLSMADMTVLEYHFMRNRLRQFPGKYSVDVARTWSSQGAEDNPILRDGDYLFVPETLEMVEVSGQVVKPGLIPWAEGKDWQYYIAAAGGLTNNSRWKGIRLISGSTGNWVRPSKKVAVNPGDTVFVAQKTDRDFWTDLKDVLTITSQVVTIFLGVRAISAN